MNAANAIGRVDRLLVAIFEKPSTVRLQFADDRTFVLDASRLELPEPQTDWSTIAPSSTGEALVVAVGGEPISIDAGTLRYLVDDAYAAEIEASIRESQFTRGELAQMVRDNPPPPEWYAEPSQDLTREGWNSR
jgi:hypothetical protein